MFTISKVIFVCTWLVLYNWLSVEAVVECYTPFECSNQTTNSTSVISIYGYKSAFGLYGNGAFIQGIAPTGSAFIRPWGAYAAQFASVITGSSAVCQGTYSVRKLSNRFS